jgi:cytosine/adenosine deaminase-related metal-dependent hydrolase
LKFLKADWVLTCDDNFTILEDAGVIFDDKIIEVGNSVYLEEKYIDLEPIYCGVNSILMPGLINSHVHLEFSANKTSLKYGNFIHWLNSVIKNREDLIEKASSDVIEQEINLMLKTGTTTIGAISSYGFDLEPCTKTPMNVVYFTEVIGSKPEMIDTLFSDFKMKYNGVQKYKSDSFIPAIAIHSAYSVHPFLVREVLNIAKNDNVPVSAHFQESKSENDWLNYSNGSFTDFFNNFLGQTQSVTKPNEFLNQFKNMQNLSFTHCVEANESEINQIKELNASIIHCPKSNRLLNNSSLNLQHLGDDISLSLGTDGLSSNNSLSLFDEMQSALFIHTNYHVEDISKRLLLAATNGGAKALGLNKGTLEVDKDADIIRLSLPDNCEVDNLLSSIILHTKSVDQVFIKGEKIEIH